MTHVSSFRYASIHAEPVAGWTRGPSPVRVSYFDPVTGEPCGSKPVPRGLRREGPTREQREAERMGKHRGAPGKGVVADGIPYASVSAAARAIGCNQTSLSQVLRKGNRTCKGHAVAWTGRER